MQLIQIYLTENGYILILTYIREFFVTFIKFYGFYLWFMFKNLAYFVLSLVLYY